MVLMLGVKDGSETFGKRWNFKPEVACGILKLDLMG